MQIVSHLYKSDGSILGAFQRIDIPILREFDQYNYVLFTGGLKPASASPRQCWPGCSVGRESLEQQVLGAFIWGAFLSRPFGLQTATYSLDGR